MDTLDQRPKPTAYGVQASLSVILHEAHDRGLSWSELLKAVEATHSLAIQKMEIEDQAIQEMEISIQDAHWSGQ